MKYRIYYLCSIIFVFIISSCSSVKYPHPAPKDYVYEKEFYAMSFEELQDKIFAQDSLFSSSLSFYYNKKFLEQYGFTLYPDISNREEYHYNGEKLDRNSYYYSDYVTYYGFRNISLFNSPYPNAQLSTPRELLDNVYNGKYNYGSYENELYYLDATMYNILNPKSEDVELNYGITYKARTVKPIMMSGEGEMILNRFSKTEMEKVMICPNYLVPSIETMDAMYKGMYQIPVVYKTNFEYITLLGRLYINNFPIDCIIFMRNSYNLNSLEEVEKIFNFAEYSSYIEQKKINTNYLLKTTFNEVDNTYSQKIRISVKKENGEIQCFEHAIQFFNFPKRDVNSFIISKNNYLHEFDNIFDEYFNSFLDGIEEVKINYNKKV